MTPGGPAGGFCPKGCLTAATAKTNPEGWHVAEAALLIYLNLVLIACQNDGPSGC
jgi:hypothetical protein